MILYCHWLEFWSHDTYIFIILSVISITNVKLLKSNNDRSNPKFLRLLWDIVVFRLVVYLLNMIRLNLRFFYKMFYIYINLSTPKMLRFQAYTPFHFSGQSFEQNCI